MQICGQEVNIETLKGKALELGALMEDPEVLASIQAKVDEANAELAAFKPEIPEVPSLQDALAELNDKLSSEEFAAKLKKIKEDFGEAVEDLDEILDKANSKINEFLSELPSSEDLAKLTDGSLVGEALAKFSAELALAEAKVRKKLAIEGKPTVDPAVVCKDVPNIEVKIKEIDVQEVKQKIINGDPQVDGDGKPVTETVTVKKQVKTRVDLPEEPKVPKEVPVPPEPKPVQRTVTVDPTTEARRILNKKQNPAVNFIREGLTGDRELIRRKTYAHIGFFYIERAKIMGITGSDKEIIAKAYERGLQPFKIRLDQELLFSVIPEGDRKKLFNKIKELYELDTDAIATKVSFEDAVKADSRFKS
jgi:hypothetical protein